MPVNKIFAGLLVMFVFAGVASAQIDCESLYFGSDIVDGIDLRSEIDHVTFGIAQTGHNDDPWSTTRRVLTGTFDLPSPGTYNVLFSSFGQGAADYIGWTSLDLQVMEADCRPFFTTEELFGVIFTTCPAKVVFTANSDSDFLFWIVINWGGERKLQCGGG
ncbi:MAG: hypothetical protein OXG09_06205 [Chloroflexi bacterium]|nr:hypothetical protein [Chloroflexota bacterium]